MTMGRYTVATTTVWSGLSYVFNKDAVTILKHPTAADVLQKGKKAEDEQKKVNL